MQPAKRVHVKKEIIKTKTYARHVYRTQLSTVSLSAWLGRTKDMYPIINTHVDREGRSTIKIIGCSKATPPRTNDPNPL